MTGRDEAIVTWTRGRQDHLLDSVASWAGIGSHSLDPAGLARMADALAGPLATLGTVRRHPVPPRTVLDDRGRAVEQPLGDVLSVGHAAARERLRVLLVIHYDTVYPAHEGAPAITLHSDGKILGGPGVADAKGGIAVLLAALEAFMRFGDSERLSWEVLLNADEELGSPGSGILLTEAAGRHDLGLVFEPALDEAGTLAGARKGSGNFTIVIRGRAAHAGRQFEAGRNAVVAAAELATKLAALTDPDRGLTVNVAELRGGAGLNVVPDLAVLRANVRAATEADAHAATTRLAEAVADLDRREGFSATLAGGFHCPPKPFDEPTRRLFDHVALCGRDLGLTLALRPTGGVCDGNKLAAAGLATLDTLGVRGGGIHGPEEHLVVESLAERAALVAILLGRLADGSLPWQRRSAAEEARPCS
jgi:glutamate carboxypeptidase